MSYVDFSVCKQRLKCWLCVFLFSRQNGAERKQRPIFTFFLPPFSSHSARHRLPLLGYPLSGKFTRQFSNYKRKNYWLYKLFIYFSDARFRMLFGFRPASGRESVPLDRRTGVSSQLVMRDLVFINFRTGMPAKNSSYDTHLYKLCDRAGIEHFCMHALRHTYATREIECGMQPRYCKSCWVTPASRLRWTDTSMSHLNPWIRLCGNLNQAGFPSI